MRQTRLKKPLQKKVQLLPAAAKKASAAAEKATAAAEKLQPLQTKLQPPPKNFRLCGKGRALRPLQKKRRRLH